MDFLQTISLVLKVNVIREGTTETNRSVAQPGRASGLGPEGHMVNACSNHVTPTFLEIRLDKLGKCAIMTFEFNGIAIPYFFHGYNCGTKWQPCTERSLEIAIVLDWLNCTPTRDLVEIGCVMPHYGYGGHRIIDLYEKYPGVENIDACQFAYRNLDVISISTLEHIQTGDNCYLLNRIVDESRTCCITIPMGFQDHPHAGQQTKDLEQTLLLTTENGMFNNKAHAFMFSRIDMFSWKQVELSRENVVGYGAIHANANTVVMIAK